MNTKKASIQLQDLIELLKENDLNINEFLWFMYGGDDNDMEYLQANDTSCFGVTETTKNYGFTGMDIVVVKEIVEGIIESAWTHVAKDSGSLALFSDPKKYTWEKLNALVSSVLPYAEVGMVVDISKNGYTGLLIRRTK